MVAIVAIVVVGPKELPKLMRTFGVYAGKLRRAAADFQRQFDEAMAESEADEVRKNIEAIRSNMGTAADFAPPPDMPLMTPITPAPDAIEQAIAPEQKKTTKRTPRTKKTPAKKAAPKRKTTAKRKTAAKRAKPKTPAKKTLAKTRTKKRAVAKKTTSRTRRKR